MEDSTTIFREPDEQEKETGTKFLNPYNEEEPNTFDKFNKVIKDTEADATKNKFPFCRRCAKLDFQRAIKDVEAELGATEGNFLSEENINKIKIPTKEQLIAKYGEDRFVHKNDTDLYDTISETISGKTMRRQIKTGVYKNYECKVRKCGFSIEFLNGWEKEAEPVKFNKVIKK